MQVGQRKTFRQAIYFLVAVLLLWACKRPPEFPLTPEISYLKITKQVGYVKVGQVVEKIDSVIISITFKDGDGDLGSDVDTVQNYYCDVIGKDSSGFSKIGDKNGRFTFLNTDRKTGPLEGTLNYSPEISDILNGDTLNPSDIFNVKFRVYIKDAAGHQSNTVETDVIEVQSYQ